MQTYLKNRPAWVQFFIFLGLALGIFLAVMVIGSLVLSAITGMPYTSVVDSNQWDWKDPKSVTLLRGFILLQFLGLFVIPSLLFAAPKPGRYLGLTKPAHPVHWVTATLLLLVAIPLVEYTGILNKEILSNQGSSSWVQGMEDEAARSIKALLSDRTIPNLLINLVFVAVFAGVGEELFFRGVIQRLLIQTFKNAWIGIIAAAFLFSLFHFQFLGFIPRFILGILLGAIYWYSGSLWPAILAHFFYDAFIIILVYFNPEMLSNPDASILENTKSLLTMALISLALVIFLLRVMRKNSNAHQHDLYQPPQPPTDKPVTF
jgi:membrane protease YdiL (CAAX protease family)